jgi:hypothetical protein
VTADCTWGGRYWERGATYTGTIVPPQGLFKPIDAAAGAVTQDHVKVRKKGSGNKVTEEANPESPKPVTDIPALKEPDQVGTLVKEGE